jgi:hypothetical protein
MGDGDVAGFVREVTGLNRSQSPKPFPDWTAIVTTCRPHLLREAQADETCRRRR